MAQDSIVLLGHLLLLPPALNTYLVHSLPDCRRRCWKTGASHSLHPLVDLTLDIAHEGQADCSTTDYSFEEETAVILTGWPEDSDMRLLRSRSAMEASRNDVDCGRLFVRIALDLLDWGW